jgi:hypothetical protein
MLSKGMTPSYYPLTMAFPPCTLVPSAGHMFAWHDGWLTMTFDGPDELRECLDATALVRGLAETRRLKIEGMSCKDHVVHVVMV